MPGRTHAGSGVRASTAADVDAWCAVARSVEAAVRCADGRRARLEPPPAPARRRTGPRGARSMPRARWSAASGGRRPRPQPAHLGWLAVLPEARGRGAGRALVETVIAHAGARRVEVVTFGAGHPAGADAEHARRLYRALDFEFEAAVPGAPDGTPRELLIRPVILRGAGFVAAAATRRRRGRAQGGRGRRATARLRVPGTGDDRASDRRDRSVARRPGRPAAPYATSASGTTRRAR